MYVIFATDSKSHKNVHAIYYDNSGAYAFYGIQCDNFVTIFMSIIF